MVTCRLADLLAGLLWAVALLLGVLDTWRPGPPGELAVWALLVSAGAATLTACSWLSRRAKDYADGVDAGLRTAQIVRLPAQRDHEHV